MDIKAISDRSDNGQIMRDAWQLGFVLPPVLDMTYGEGTFWKDLPGMDVCRNDLDETKGAVHFDCRAMPLASRTFATVVFDPPYQLRGTPSRPEMDARFGTTEPQTRNEILALLAGGTAEGCRLADQFLLVKCMDQVEASKVRWQTDVVSDVAKALEFRKVDQLMLVGGRPQPEGTSQKHARHNYSTLLVFGRR